MRDGLNGVEHVLHEPVDELPGDGSGDEEHAPKSEDLKEEEADENLQEYFELEDYKHFPEEGFEVCDQPFVEGHFVEVEGKHRDAPPTNTQPHEDEDVADLAEGSSFSFSSLDFGSSRRRKEWVGDEED